MPNKHKHPPIAYRPPQAVRDRLLAFAEKNARPVASVITEAVTKLLDKAEAEVTSCTHSYPDVRNVAGVRVCRLCG